MKGVILAGGRGTRMLPATEVMNKHLIPILNKPMIMYPIDTLKSFAITEILLISGGEHMGTMMEFLGDGSRFGVNLTYKIQTKAGGIAEALSLAEDFVGGENFMVILGDNVFETPIKTKLGENAKIFLKKVGDPGRFGVAKVDTRGRVLSIEEKPEKPQSDLAVTGLYYFPKDVFNVIKGLKPSGRGELEITDVNNFYVNMRRMDSDVVEGFWSDAGTPDSLFRTINFLYSYERRGENSEW